jgi:uncharacterized protein YndB with AHSA1/START domain
MTIHNAPIQETSVSRTYSAPLAKVWKAWIDPVHVEAWFGPSPFTNRVAAWNVKPGNAIDLTMIDPGGTEYPMGGEFREVVEHEKIVFLSTAFLHDDGTADLEALNTVTFEENDGKTTVTVHSSVLKAQGMALQAIKGQEEGWRMSLETLADVLA